MKQFKHISMLLAFAAVLSLIGCTKDRTMDGGGAISGEDDGKYFYVSAAIALPSAGSRSATDDYDPNDEDDKYGDTNSDIDQETDSEGNPFEDFEYGYDYENDVRSMLIVVATKEDKYVTHTFVKGIESVPTGTKFDFYANGEIKHSEMEKAYKDGGVLSGDKTVHIYVYCNYTARLRNLFNDPESEGESYDNWTNWFGTVEEDPSPAGQQPTILNTIWASRSFLMTNARLFETTFPAKIEDWEEYADASNPFPMHKEQETNSPGVPKKDGEETPIYVERAAARFDFKDGSDYEVDGKKVPYTYPLWIDLGDEDSGDEETDTQIADDATEKGQYNLFSIKLTRMALVNMSKNFYYLRRVSDDGFAKAESTNDDNNNGTSSTTTTNPNNWTLSGLEKSKNYVVDTDALVKAEKGDATNGGHVKIEPSNAETYFNFTLFDKKNQIDTKGEVFGYNKTAWYADNISDVVEKGKKDTWSGSADNKYSIWRYVTENTIPQNNDAVGGDNENDHLFDLQKTKQSVGIVFKGSIIAGEDINERYTENSEEADVDDDDDDVDTAAQADEPGTEPGTTEPAKKPKREVHYVSLDVRYALAAAKEHIKYDETADAVITEAIRKADANETDASEAAKEIAKNLPDSKTGSYNYPVLYSFDNKLYAGVDDLVKGAVRKGLGSRLEFAVNAILANWQLSADGTKYTHVDSKGSGTSTTTGTVLTVKAYYDDIINGKVTIEGIDRIKNNKETDATFMAYAPAQGITVYEISNETGDDEGWGYYCYYFYWNRHNDNLKSGRMGRMEFATVRNNVYKLAVTKIGQIGHPGDPGKDPDPVKPEDPDEDPTDYIQVKVEVLPWVVRVNDITF